MQFAVMLTVLSNLIQFYYHRGQQYKQDSVSSASAFGPVVCVSVACILLMIHPTIFILKDLKLIAPVCKSSLARWGLQACTLTGFFNLFYAAYWGTAGIKGGLKH